MITVSEAENIILSNTKNYGVELVSFEDALGRVLAEDILADRDLPPCNRVTMDGIAIAYAAFENGIRSFHIKATQAAGHKPLDIERPDECIEIMTGAAVPYTTDTIIRYEDVEIKNSIATFIAEAVKKGQNVHRKGKDKKQGDTVIPAAQVIDATVISMAASVGRYVLPVKKLPTVVIISTGDELVDITEEPTFYQVRRSNNYTIKAALHQYGIHARMLHLPDEKERTKKELEICISQYDVIILSGGISMGKFDYIPQVLEELLVTKLFHKVKQRPGKPFWFGTHADGTLVFAFPGNPVSTFMCLHRYLIPWIESSLQIPNSKFRFPKYAVLNEDVTFTAPLQYFMQVKVNISEQGQLLATPTVGNGSGDFANLIDSSGFIELPMDQSNFKKGEVYKIWPFKQIL